MTEPDIHVTEKKKKAPHKRKMSAHNDSPGSSGHAHSLPVPGATPTGATLPKTQESNNELAEMRAMFKEMKALTEKNSAFMERFVEQNQFAQGPVQGEFDEHPDLDMVSHEQIVTTEEVPLAPTYEDIPVFADSQEAAWDSDNEAEQADDELPDNYLEVLQKLMSKKKPSASQGAPAATNDNAACAIGSTGGGVVS